MAVERCLFQGYLGIMSQLKYRPKSTVEDYLSLPPDVRAELIEGELYMTPSPRPRHQEIGSNVNSVLKDYVVARHLGQVYFAPLDVFLPSGSIVQSDVIFIVRDNLFIVGDRLEGVPDLLFEVVSPSGAVRDRLVKRRLYADNGVPEYWSVDDESRSVEVLTLVGGEYAPDGYFVVGHDDGERVRSRVVSGFTCPCAEIFQTFL